MKLHTVHTEAILQRIDAFSNFAFVAASHHERLDGKGYPRGLSGDQIPFESRIITTADIFDALTAERPYRAAMPISKALAIMQSDLGAAIDGRCFDALNRALERAQFSVAA
jgi:HD-GYP domain-containing protein (c-di-GMP phosphodiesterase class II)